MFIFKQGIDLFIESISYEEKKLMIKNNPQSDSLIP